MKKTGTLLVAAVATDGTAVAAGTTGVLQGHSLTNLFVHLADGREVRVPNKALKIGRVA